MSDADYLAAYTLLVEPILEAFAPDLLLISAGFDAAEGDIHGKRSTLTLTLTLTLTPSPTPTLTLTLALALALALALTLTLTLTLTVTLTLALTRQDVHLPLGLRRHDGALAPRRGLPRRCRARGGI